MVGEDCTRTYKDIVTDIGSRGDIDTRLDTNVIADSHRTVDLGIRSYQAVVSYSHIAVDENVVISFPEILTYLHYNTPPDDLINHHN
jgi:hypothetical protein